MEKSCIVKMNSWSIDVVILEETFRMTYAYLYDKKVKMNVRQTSHQSDFYDGVNSSS